MENKGKLTDEFLIELIKSCLVSKKILQICSTYLHYEFIPIEPLKKIWKNIKDDFELTGEILTFGVLNERLKSDDKAIDYLLHIKKTNVADKKETILKEFDVFIKRTKFVDLYNRVGRMYNKGDHAEAIDLFVKESPEIANSTIQEKYYTTVFGEFTTRHEERVKRKHHDDSKIPYGIHPLDYFTNGGGNRGTSALFMARSGGFKSTLLRWIGLSSARLGKRVVHFQCEGSEADCLDAYDAAWTGIDLDQIEFGEVPSKYKDQIKKVNRDIVDKGGEIYVVAGETIDSLYIDDCYETIVEIEKVFGKVDLVIFDYLEIFNTRGKYLTNEVGERKRRADIGTKITNIAASLDVLSVSATQANNIAPEKYNLVDWCMSRNEISEFKAAINPFSLFATLNQTDDEYNAGVIRIHIDKLRKYRRNITFKIYQSQNNSRFYDSRKTIDAFWDINSNKVIG